MACKIIVSMIFLWYNNHYVKRVSACHNANFYNLHGIYLAYPYRLFTLLSRYWNV